MRTIWLMLGVLAVLSALGQQRTTTVSGPQDSGSPGAGGTVRTDTRFDLYGNSISEALADYRVDHRGNLYERHAPDTALLELGPPGT